MAAEAISNPPPPLIPKKKRNLPGTPDPDAEVIALSPKTLLATNRFLCEICGKGFQRDQNLQLHRRGHNLPWKLKQRTTRDPRKRVYVCPEKGCVHNHPSRALGDLTGIKKHFCRKHGDKKWKCDKCNKKYAVHSDWKAHSKTCGTRHYKCDCGTIFSRRDSFITHRAFCDALAEETARINSTASTNIVQNLNYHFATRPNNMLQDLSLWIGDNNNGGSAIESMNVSALYGYQNYAAPVTNIDQQQLESMLYGNNLQSSTSTVTTKDGGNSSNSCVLESTSVPSLFSGQDCLGGFALSSADMSATALLQRAAQVGVKLQRNQDCDDQDAGKLISTGVLFSMSTNTNNINLGSSISDFSTVTNFGVGGEITRDFLGVGATDQFDGHFN